MLSIIQQLNKDAVNIKKLLTNLIACSNIIRWNYSKIVTISGDYQWGRLNDSGEKIQAQLLKEYQHFINMIRFLLIELSQEQHRRFEATNQEVLHIIEQNSCLSTINKEERLQLAMKAVSYQVNLLSASYEITADRYLIVPDGEALLANPDIENWTFSGIETFNLILLSIVAAEVEQVIAKNNSLRNKGKNLIQKIKEYVKRGNIKEGVMLAEKNMISYIDIQEGDKTLPWIHSHDRRDRILAAYFQVVRANPHSQVILVTNDAKLQEKALFSRALFLNSPTLKANQ